METTSARNLIEPSRFRSRLIVLLCIATVMFVGGFLFTRVPFLLVDFHYFVEAPEPNTRLFLTRAARLALMSDNMAELDAFGKLDPLLGLENGSRG